jgi:hypothetical protein
MDEVGSPREVTPSSPLLLSHCMHFSSVNSFIPNIAFWSSIFENKKKAFVTFNKLRTKF